MLALRHIARRRMVFVEIAPEHVLHAVGGIEDAGAEALLRFVERVEQHLLAVFVITVGLRQKSVVVEHVLVERPSVFREAKRGNAPYSFAR